MLVQESNQSFGTAIPQLLSLGQLTLFDTSKAQPKSVSDAENALIQIVWDSPDLTVFHLF